MRITPRQQNSPISQQIRSRMIHTRDGRRRQQLKPIRRIISRVQARLERGLAGISPPLRPNLRAVDNQNLSVGEQHHVAHGPRYWHVLHRPGRRGVRHHHPATALLCRLALVHASAGTAADQYLGNLEPILVRKREERHGSRCWVVPRLARHCWIVSKDNARVVVEEARVARGEDPEVAVWEDGDVRVQVVFAGHEEREVEFAFCRGSLGDEFIARSARTTDDDLPLAIGEDMIGGVPTSYGEFGGVVLNPVAGATRGARDEGTDLLTTFEIAAGLHEPTICHERAGTAPGVGKYEERADSVGERVEHHGVRGAVNFQQTLQRLVTTKPICKGDLGRADVGAVEHNGGVIAGHRRVH